MIRIGTKFRESRSKKGLTLEEISNATKIRKEFLEAIENGEYKKLPSSAYAMGFVRNYARFLGLDEKQSIAFFKREFDSEKTFEVLPKFSAGSEISLKKFRLGWNPILLLSVIVFLALFIFFQYKDAIFSPSLHVISPKDGETITSQDFEVLGKSDPNSTVFVEDQPVSLDSEGNFKKIITVFPGKSSLSIRSENRFGRETEIIRQINVNPIY